jgi:EmrB/QacA subfamily drug resistance transporter
MSTVAGGRSMSSSSQPGYLRLSDAQGRWVIAATVLGSGIAMIDATVVGIALPTIGRDFHTPLGPLQWVITGYTLTLAAFLLLGGSLGDRFGRRKVFMIGVAWFAAASVLCGLAPNATILTVLRTLQGVGGALLTPGSLAIIEASFTDEDRARAIGAWSGLGGLATAAGPLLGGYLVTYASWRFIFFINVPIAAVVLAVSARHVPESKDPSVEHVTDVAGAVLGVAALAGINYALIEGSSQGWRSPAVISAAAVAFFGAIGFVLVERAARSPMLPLQIFKSRQFSATNIVTFVVYGALGAALFLLPIELQVVSHYSALEAGVSLLPLTIIMLVFSARSGRLAGRIGPRMQMTVGPLVVAAGLALLVRATSGANYFVYVFPAVVVFAAGLATTVAPLTATAMGSAPAERAGIASAVNNDVARVASLVAVAVVPWLAGIPGTTYLHSQALVQGFRHAMLIAAGVCAAGGVVAAVGIRNPKKQPQKKPEGKGIDRRPKLRVLQPSSCALDAPPFECGRPSPALAQTGSAPERTGTQGGAGASELAAAPPQDLRDPPPPDA